MKTDTAPGLVATVPDEPHTCDWSVHKALRDNAVDVLYADGVPMSDRVEEALRDTPRHPFAPVFSVLGEDGRYVAHTQLGQGVEADDARAAAWTLLYSPELRPVVSFADDGQPEVAMDTMYDVARLLELAEVQTGRRVLEIGTGSGYGTALLMRLAGASANVVTVDRNPFAVHSAHARIPDKMGPPTVVCGDGADGYRSGGSYGLVLSWCDVKRVPGAWLRQLGSKGRVVTTVAGQPICLQRRAEGALKVEVSGRFAAGGPVLASSPLRRAGEVSAAPGLAELAEMADRGGARTSAYVPHGGGGLEHPTVQWLLSLVHPELVFEVHDGFYRILDPFGRSWVNAHPQSNGTDYVQAGGVRRTLWNEVMAVFTLWTHQGRPERHRFGLTVMDSGEHALWLDEPWSVLLSLDVPRH